MKFITTDKQIVTDPNILEITFRRIYGFLRDISKGVRLEVITEGFAETLRCCSQIWN